MRKQREALREYFKNGDRPTESQFSELIESYVHLNELNFGLKVHPSGTVKNGFYHFYVANDVQYANGGHKIVEDPSQGVAAAIPGYKHLSSENVLYKELVFKIQGAIDIAKHQPKIIIERYKQKKKLASGYIKPAGFYKESMPDAKFWNRKSEYDVTSREMTIDIAPINYFRPSKSFSNFSPSGSINKPGSFKYSRHSKPYVPIQVKLQITIDNMDYTSHPIDLKIVLGNGEPTDAINFAFD